ncbi:Chorismate mutase 2 [Acorus gramineus]|uniref:chorismate mutase n=1 Tax=Acorus gramineus TaxID=55184 RepID=A0AAV9AUX7_ACOGR|nr:Chorismate mutase 2 [Acorus gramineus]
MATPFSNNNKKNRRQRHSSPVSREDTIVFSLIERVRFPLNRPAYVAGSAVSGSCGSLGEFVIRETEAVYAKVLDVYVNCYGISRMASRYENPEELPFFPESLPPQGSSPLKNGTFLYPAGASINMNNNIRSLYFEKLLPLFIVGGDDGNYVPTVQSDLASLQSLSRRIHYGRFVAEVKYRDAPQDYEPAIRAKDRNALMKLLTSESVEEMVKRRVKKKAMVFGQNVTLGDDKDNKPRYKIDPLVVSRIYGEWVIPLTKIVQVEYLLRRLD